MEVNEIITNEEDIKAVMEVAKACISNGFKKGFGIGCIAVVAVAAAGKYAFIPLAKKIKAKLDKKKAESTLDDQSEVSEVTIIDEDDEIKGI